VVLILAGVATDSRNKVNSEATKLFFASEFFLARQLLFAALVFFVTRLFCATGTIVPIPISCAGLPLEAACVVCSEVQKGVSDADAEWGLVLFATTGGRVRMRSVKNRLESY
jgi:hypothetical protein